MFTWKECPVTIDHFPLKYVTDREYLIFIYESMYTTSPIGL